MILEQGLMTNLSNEQTHQYSYNSYLKHRWFRCLPYSLTPIPEAVVSVAHYSSNPIVYISELYHDTIAYFQHKLSQSHT